MTPYSELRKLPAEEQLKVLVEEGRGNGALANGLRKELESSANPDEPKRRRFGAVMMTYTSQSDNQDSRLQE